MTNKNLSKIIVPIPRGYQFFEEAHKTLVYLKKVPLNLLVRVVVSDYVLFLNCDQWPEYSNGYFEDFIFNPYLPSLEDFNGDFDAFGNHVWNAMNELADLTVDLHYFNVDSQRYNVAIFRQPANYRVSRIRPFGGPRKHMEVWLELRAFEDEDYEERFSYGLGTELQE